MVSSWVKQALASDVYGVDIVAADCEGCHTFAGKPTVFVLRKFGREE